MLQTFLRTFRKDTFAEQKCDTIRFKFELGASFNCKSGFYEKGHPECMADFHFYRVNPGDRLQLSQAEYQYNLAAYSNEIEDRLIYTYCYQEEESWARYQNNFNTDGWSDAGLTFEESGWVRISVRRKDGGVLTEADLVSFSEACCLVCRQEAYQEKQCFFQEIEETARTVGEKRNEDSLVFGLMTDSHYVINGGWEDSIANLQAVHGKVKFDAMVHLGDLTDGMVPLSITKEYADRVMADLKGLGIPVYLVLGNHDSNYFHGNPEWMTQQEQSEYYLQRQKPWYYVDFEKQRMRCLFLHSFNHKEKVRYGFSAEEVEWVKQTLEQTPADYSVLVLAHVPLLAKMHFWSDEIRNSAEMKQVFDEYVQKGGTILAYIHGHNHADQIEYTEHFPIVAIGCAKCEDFKDKKPEGSVTYDREMGTVSQELWDVMVVDTKRLKIDFVRFGAGEDRTVSIKRPGCGFTEDQTATEKRR